MLWLLAQQWMLMLICQSFNVNGAGVAATLGVISLISVVFGAGLAWQSQRSTVEELRRGMADLEAERVALEAAFEKAIGDLRDDFKTMIAELRKDLADDRAEDREEIKSQRRDLSDLRLWVAQIRPLAPGTLKR